MDLWEIVLEVSYNQRKTRPGGSNIPVICNWLLKTTSRLVASPGDIAGRLLLSLDVVHGAVPVAERLHSHQAVPIVAALVQLAERCNYIGQRPEITLRGVILANR